MLFGVLKFNVSSEETFREALKAEQLDILDDEEYITVDYQEPSLDPAKKLMLRPEVIKAEGELIDDGEMDLNEAGKFRIFKEDGKVKTETPIFLSELSFAELVTELKRRTDEGAYN